ncbi:MAG TPA: hypothetical protein VLJ39_20540, partial [Tepidisphaeraceae bacterium]|nr:hypothetical protein [Tepidisphaeraceae bacterium]
PAYFYAENLLAHALSAGFAFLCIRRLVKSPWAAWVGAGLFALHPIQVEAVSMAWTVYTPLSGMFALLALWQYLVYSDRRFGLGPDARTKSGWLNYGVATAAFVLGLLTKPQIVPLPLMAGAIEWGLRGRKPRQLLPLVPWLVVALLDVWANRLSSPSAKVYVPETWQLPVVALDAIAFYLWKVCLPLHLTLDYGRSPWWLTQHPRAWATALAPLALGITSWLLRKRLPALATSVAIFALGLLPTLGLVPFDFQTISTVSDRFAYLAMLGPALLLARIMDHTRRPLAGVIGLAILLPLATLSLRQLRYWQDDWTVAAHLLEENHESKGVIGSFRYLFSRYGHYDPPEAPFPASSHCSLDRQTLVRSGDLLRKARYWDLAEGCYRQALLKGRPDATLYDKLGATLMGAIEPERAAEAYREALRIRPDDPQAREGLQAALQSIGPRSQPSR